MNCPPVRLEPEGSKKDHERRQQFGYSPSIERGIDMEHSEILKAHCLSLDTLYGLVAD
jgi:hypothetical protein